MYIDNAHSYKFFLRNAWNRFYKILQYFISPIRDKISCEILRRRKDDNLLKITDQLDYPYYIVKFYKAKNH